MAMTRSLLQVSLGRRVGPCSGLGDFDEAASYALAVCGIAAADPAAVADADFLTLAAADEVRLRDVAEWRLLDGILNNLDAASLVAIGVEDDPDRVAARIRGRVDAAYARIVRQYDFGLPTLQIGVVSLGTSQQDDFTAINY